MKLRSFISTSELELAGKGFALIRIYKKTATTKSQSPLCWSGPRLFLIIRLLDLSHWDSSTLLGPTLINRRWEEELHLPHVGQFLHCASRVSTCPVWVCFKFGDFFFFLNYSFIFFLDFAQSCSENVLRSRTGTNNDREMLYGKQFFFFFWILHAGPSISRAFNHCWAPGYLKEKICKWW